MAISSVKATLNGTEYTLTYNATSGKYEATLTAPTKSSYTLSPQYYPVSVTAYDTSGNYATVDATDATFGSNLRLKVVEKVAPTVSITSPTDSARLTNNKPTISFTCSDNDSGVDASTITLKIDGTPVTGTITKSGTDAKYTCSYVPTTALADGSHTLVVTCDDHDGNTGTSATVTFSVDTVAPVLNVLSPSADTTTNNPTLTVSGTTNDASSSPITLTVNGTDVPVTTGGAFSTTVTLVAGENTITVIATDASGLKTTVTRKVTLDTSVPVFKSISLVPNPADAGTTFVISVEVTD